MPKPTLFASVKPEKVEWLSPGRLAVGKITVIDGDPRLGKSLITVDWASRITRGVALLGERGWADEEQIRDPRGVVFISGEDGLADTIVPRFLAAGGNGRKAMRLEMTDEAGNDFSPDLDVHLWAIEQQIEAMNAALLVIDPLMAHVGATTNANRDQDIRRVLSPLASMAERTRCAVLVLRHLNKAVGMSSLYRGGGSIGIIGAARVGLLAGKDQRDETGQRRLLAVQKCNIGPEGLTLAYRVASVEGTDTARIEWLGETDARAGDIVGEEKDRGEREEMSESQIWLHDFLIDGPRSAVEVYREGGKAGFAQRTLKWAKAEIGAKASKTGFGKNGEWSWRLPMDARPPKPYGDLKPKVTPASDPFSDDDG